MEHLDVVLSSKELVSGVIYKITCLTTNKIYIGQAVSHRLNKGKYKPFGSNGRFKDHISEAINNTKKGQCVYLNNAIRKYGSENFTCVTLVHCSRKKLDAYEKLFIKLANSICPHGYNLTKGGKTTEHIKITNNVPLNEPQKIRNLGRILSDETKRKIAESNKEYYLAEETKRQRSLLSMIQHDKEKAKKFIGKIKLSKDTDLHFLIRKQKYKNTIQSVVVLEGNHISFSGKYCTEEENYQRAITFLEQLR